MDGAKTVSATFTQDEYTLNVMVTGQGWVVKEPDEPTYTYDQQVMLIALPEEGYTFSGWSGGGCSGAGMCTVLVTGNTTVTAVFIPKEYTLDVTIDPDAGGTVAKDPDQQTYAYGTEVTLAATPAAGYTFAGWSGDLSGSDNPAYVRIDRNIAVTAHFVQDVTLPKDLVDDPGVLREGFETLDGWTVSGSPSGFSALADSSLQKEGASSIKLTAPAGGYVHLTKDVAWDLSAIDERGNFRFWVYVHDATEPRDFQILASSDATFQNYFITYYNEAYKLRYRPGWNLINLRAEDWHVGLGSPDWSNIERISIRVYDLTTSTTPKSFNIDGLTSGVVAQPAILFTFDDSHSSLYTQAFEYMWTRNVRGTGYIATDWVEELNRVTWDQLNSMYSSGWTIGNNTAAGAYLTSMTLAEQLAALQGAQTALNAHSMTNVDYAAYPGGAYNADTLTAMANLGMRTGRTLLTFNSVSPLASPFELSQRSIARSTTLATAKSWVDTAKSRQEILVITLHGISAAPGSSDWYIDSFRSLVDYCIQQGIPVLTMDDLYQLQSGSISIPGAR